MPKKIVFISGPYRGDIEGNIARARAAAIRLWKLGYVVLCPHLNTAHFDGECPDEVWLDGDLELLRRCDAIYLLKDWKASAGAVEEFRLALDLNKQIMMEGIDDDGQAVQHV